MKKRPEMAAFFMEILRLYILTVKQNFGRLDLYLSDSGRKGRCAMENRNVLPKAIAGGLMVEIIFLKLSFLIAWFSCGLEKSTPAGQIAV